MDQLSDLLEGLRIEPIGLLDIVLTALLIYGLFSLIQGTRAVRLVVGAMILYLLYALAQALDLRLLSSIMEAGALVGLLALVVIFQPELRRGLERIGRVGTLAWAMPAPDPASADRVAVVLARTASGLAAGQVGALIVVERENGLQDIAETGVMLHADLSPELLASIFAPHAALHDGAVIIRGDRVLAAGALLPLSEVSPTQERLGTRHRAAIGITEQTDALALVVSEESGRVALVEHGRVLRDLDEDRLRTALVSLLRAPVAPDMPLRKGALGGRALRGKRARGWQMRRSRPTMEAPAQHPSPIAVSDAAAGPGTAGRVE